MTEREEEILSWIKENPMISQQEIADRANITRSSVAVHISNLMKKGKIKGKGYVVSEESYVTVIGGANMDISGTPSKPLFMGDSNPGKISISRGGVGRNIAENLSRLGVNVELITVLGDDIYGQELLRSCRELGIGVKHTLIAAGEATSTYLCVNSEKGDMEVAVNEMDLYHRLTPEYLESKLAVINRSRLVVIDANLTEEAITFLAENCTVPILAEPVSAAKAKKLLSVLDKLYAMKPNRLELATLTGRDTDTEVLTEEAALTAAAKELIARGVREVYVSLGSHGVLAVDEKESLHLDCLPCTVVNTTGCGDAFMAAVAWAFVNDMDLQEKTKAGLAASSICVETMGANSTNMKEEALRKRMKD